VALVLPDIVISGAGSAGSLLAALRQVGVADGEEEAHRLPDVVSKGASSPLAGAVALMVERIANYNTAAG
jgi:hypothetical protein